MRPVGAEQGGRLDPVDHRIEAAAGIGLGADRIDAGVSATALGQRLDLLVDIVLLEIQGLRAGGLRQRQALGHGVDREHALGAKKEGAADRHLADRAAAPDRDRVAWLDVAELGAHVAGREDVRQEQNLLVAQMARHLDRADIGKRHAQIFRLAAGIAAQQMGVAEQPGGRVAPELLRLRPVGIGALAAGIEAALAEEAFAASDRERHDHAVADLERLVVGADLDHLAHRLMAEHVAPLHARHHAIIEMQVRTADGAGGHLDDGIAAMLDLGVGHMLAAHVALAMPGQRFHGLSFAGSCISCARRT